MIEALTPFEKTLYVTFCKYKSLSVTMIDNFNDNALILCVSKKYKILTFTHSCNVNFTLTDLINV